MQASWKRSSRLAARPSPSRISQNPELRRRACRRRACHSMAGARQRRVDRLRARTQGAWADHCRYRHCADRRTAGVHPRVDAARPVRWPRGLAEPVGPTSPIPSEADRNAGHGTACPDPGLTWKQSAPGTRRSSLQPETALQTGPRRPAAPNWRPPQSPSRSSRRQPEQPAPAMPPRRRPRFGLAPAARTLFAAIVRRRRSLSPRQSP